MKFAVLKALTRPGYLGATWKTHLQDAYLEKPDIVRKDYEKLVRAIADLELMEKYLREEVLHLDEETSGLRDAIDRAVHIGALFAPIIGLFDRKHGVDIANVLSDVENIVSRIPGIGRHTTLSGQPTGVEKRAAEIITERAEARNPKENVNRYVNTADMFPSGFGSELRHLL